MKKICVLYVLYCLLPIICIVSAARSEIVINELLAASQSVDSNGDPLEWIELYNTGASSVNLQGYSLTDDPDEPQKWVFPSVTILSGGFLRIWTSGIDNPTPANLHTNFRLKREGERVLLFRADGGLSDSVQYPRQRADISYGRQPDGGANWFYFPTPTPQQPNTTVTRTGIASKPDFSRPAGVYANAFDLILIPQEPESVIRYTLDGSEPTESSAVFSDPLRIAESTPVRARAFKDGFVSSNVETNTFIIRSGMNLPIMEFTTDPDNLFDRRTGIYENPNNSGRQWERPVMVEFFTMDGSRAFAEDAGLRIHGGASRARSPRKSFRLYFRSEYGVSKLEYPLFPDTPVDTFNQLVIRGGFNDTWTYDRPVQRDTAIYVSDQATRDLQNDMGHLSSHGIFVELYLNGEYWGLYNPCERYEKEMMQEYFDTDNFDVIDEEGAVDGDTEAWNELRGYLQRNNLTSSQRYEEVQSMIDLENFTDYIILNTWLQNYDWPHHNWYAAREREDGAKWRFFMWDAEYSYGSGIQGFQVAQNTMQNAADAGTGVIGTLFGKLRLNNDYRQYYWQRLNLHLKNTLSEANVAEGLERWIQNVRPAIADEAERWTNDKDLSDFDDAADKARDFISQRTPIYLRYVEQMMGAAPVGVDDWGVY